MLREDAVSDQTTSSDPDVSAHAVSLNPALQDLVSLLADTKQHATLSNILHALLTDKELSELSNRLQIFALLAQGLPQRDIAKRLGVGIATVSRGAKAYKANDIPSLMPFLTAIKVS